jgi:spore maturation protein A
MAGAAPPGVSQSKPALFACGRLGKKAKCMGFRGPRAVRPGGCPHLLGGLQLSQGKDKEGRMNTVWLVVVCISIVFAAINGRIDGFTKAMFEAGKAAVEVCLYLVGIVSLWLGLTKILEDSGLIYKLSNFFRPAISFLFRNIPEGHPSITSITLNLLANLFGLGNAATPLGIKAMEDLQTLNPENDTITFEMMLFIVINTSSIQLIPFTVIGLLASYGSRNPNVVVLPTLISTVVSSATAVGILFLFKKFSRKDR